MASLKDIRRRIVSVKNTQQITKAMKMVSAAKLRRAQQAISGARPFALKLEELTRRLVEEIVAAKPKGFDVAQIHPLLRKPDGETKRIALIIVSSDRSLCGAYNGNAAKFGVRRYNELKQSADTEIEVFFAGKKAFDLCKRRGVNGELLANFWAGKFTTQKSDAVANQFIADFLAGKFSSVEIVHTQFQSAIAQTPAIKQVLPLALDAATTSNTAGAAGESAETPLGFLYEPKDRVEILGEILPMQVRTQFYRCFADSLASEFGSRMTSMDNATRNAAGMISRLTLQANRVRQAAITTELMEIIGGAEALKG